MRAHIPHKTSAILHLTMEKQKKIPDFFFIGDPFFAIRFSLFFHLASDKISKM